MAKIRHRSLLFATPVQNWTGIACTPPARMSSEPWFSFWSERPHAKTSTLPAWMPLLRTCTLELRTSVPLNGSRCHVTRLDVPRGTTSHGTRTGYLPAPLVVGVATMAPAMWKMGVHVRAAVETVTAASLGAIDGKLAA